MKEEFDALFAEHQKLLGELQAMRALAQPEQEPIVWKDQQGNVRMTIDSEEIQSSVGPEQGPVAWESILGAVARGWCYEENANKTIDKDLAEAIAKEVQALYTTPPQRKEPEQEPVAWCSQFEHSCVQPPRRKPLTDEQIKDCLDAADQMYCEHDGDKEVFKARAIEAAHGIKE